MISLPDILVFADDFNAVKKILTEKFGGFPQFKCYEMVIKDEPVLAISFFYQGIQFEVFAQSTPSIKQHGYKHFLIEERLLKIGGKPFAEKVEKARAQGLKTEPAFAKVLGLSGDPFEELLTIQKQSNQTLKEMMK